MAHPVVLLANHYQFTPGQELESPCVGSRMLLWCRQGLGTVVVDGRTCPLPAERWLLLPWRHRVCYQADRRRPFLVGGIHLCPDHDQSVPVEPGVPHAVDDPRHALACRRDAVWPGLGGIAGGGCADHPGLRDLAEWVVARWTEQPVGAEQARAMGVLLVAELLATAGRTRAAAVPPALATALGRARADLARPLDLAALAAAAGCSPATLVRLFRGHLRCSPMAWLRSERLEAARRLLASTALPIAEVGARVGIVDPHRFSRMFQAATGMSPRQWRQHRQL
jgi:AraC-like DNA-binding protein